MNQLARFSFLFAILLFTTVSFAENFVCKENYKTVKTGDTMEMVRAACGAPSQISEREEVTQSPKSSVQWTYNAIPTIYKNGVPYTIYLPTIVVNFEDNKV